METQQLNCASCGSPIQIPENTDLVTCPYCRTHLSVERDENYASLKVVEQLGQVVQLSVNATQAAIRDGAQDTQSELKRLEISQDLALVQLQLTNIQSEIRSLEREKKDKVVKSQIGELHIQENNLKQRIQTLQAALIPHQPLSPNEAVQTEGQVHRKRQPISGLVFVLIGGSIFLLGSCIFVVFILAQLENNAGVTDNLTGFIGAQTLCSLPLILIGLVLSVIGFVRLRNTKKAISVSSSAKLES